MDDKTFKENCIRALSHCIKGCRRKVMIDKNVKIEERWIEDPNRFIEYCYQIDKPSNHNEEFVLKRINKNGHYVEGNITLVKGGF